MHASFDCLYPDISIPIQVNAIKEDNHRVGWWLQSSRKIKRIPLGTAEIIKLDKEVKFLFRVCLKQLKRYLLLNLKLRLSNQTEHFVSTFQRSNEQQHKEQGRMATANKAKHNTGS